MQNIVNWVSVEHVPLQLHPVAERTLKQNHKCHPSNPEVNPVKTKNNNENEGGGLNTGVWGLQNT